jgi:hypothetical protein
MPFWISIFLKFLTIQKPTGYITESPMCNSMYQPQHALSHKKRRNSPPSTITPHLVGWTPTVQNNLPALYRTSYKTLPKASCIEHLAGTKSYTGKWTMRWQLSSPSVSAISNASLDSFNDPPVTCSRSKPRKGIKFLRDEGRLETTRGGAGGRTMMRSTPAAHARARTVGMSPAWHCLPW